MHLNQRRHSSRSVLQRDDTELQALASKFLDFKTVAAEEASNKANLSGSTLEEIVALVTSNAVQVSNIASASEEQSAATEEMSRNIELVNDIATKTVGDMMNSTKYTEELTDLAEETREVIASLKE